MSVLLPDNLSELWLADLLLTGETTDDSGATFTITAVEDGFTFDNPQPIDVQVQRWMTDGAVASTQGHDNREIYFQVRVSADTSAQLAAGEAALASRANQSTTLCWTPPEGDPQAATSVFEVWTWHLEHAFDGLNELRLERTYGLRLTAKPWVRSRDLVTIDALPTVASPTVTSIDTCTSTTGWTGSPNAATTSGGAVKESMTATPFGGLATYLLSLTRAGSVTGMLTTPYVLIDATITGGSGSVSVTADGVPLTLAASLGNLTWWAMPTGVDSFSSLVISTSITVGHHGTITLAVNDVSKADSPGGVGSHKQLFRTIDVDGSVPTSGSIEIAAPDGVTALGTVLVHTCRDNGLGYVPAMRRYRTGGGTVTTDAACVSGARERIDTGFVTWTIPPGQIIEATYAVIARLKCDTTDRQPVLIAASQAGRSYSNLAPYTWVNFAVANTWQWSVLGLWTLPPSPVPSESTSPIAVQMIVNGLVAGYTPQPTWLDELYLLDVTHGSVSLVNTSGAPFLWLDAPDADPVRNRPALYVGSSDDRSDAVGAAGSQILSLGDHDLHPDGSTLFTVTDGVADAEASLAYFPRWHTHAGS